MKDTGMPEDVMAAVQSLAGALAAHKMTGSVELEKEVKASKSEDEDGDDDDYSEEEEEEEDHDTNTLEAAVEGLLEDWDEYEGNELAEQYYNDLKKALEDHA